MRCRPVKFALRGIATPEKIQSMSVTEVADSWLLSKQGEVKKSTHGYYKEAAGIYIQRDAMRHSFAVLALKQHKPINWIQRQMGHRTLQMLRKHYWRWIPTDDLSAEEMSSLESAAAPQPSNDAHPLPTRPENGTQAGS